VIGGVFLIGMVLSKLSCATPDRALLKPDVVQTKQDPKLAIAVLRAQKTLGTFVERFNHPAADDKGFGILARFDTPKGNEFMWLHLKEIKGDTFTGTLADEPVAIPGSHKGDSRTVGKSQICDWAYQHAGQKVGGFTLDVLR
jgi:uncharacterized protein YegJ (DUF2314 family)